MSPAVQILSSPRLGEGHRVFLEARGMEWKPSPDCTAAEQIVEFSGRICYMSFGPERQAPGSTRDYIKRLIQKGHESVLEHAAWSFVIYGVSRSFSHQLVRHRVGFSFSQLSQQYHEETGAAFVSPPGLESDPELLAQWEKTVTELRDTYSKLLHSNLRTTALVPREELRLRRSLARSVLPNAIETAIVVTANARALRHFLKIRGCVEGDIEMRMVSASLLHALEKEAPSLFYDFGVQQWPDGWPIVIQNDGADGQSS